MVKMEIPLDQLKHIWKRIISLGAKDIILAGGEPTLHSQWEEILSSMDNTFDCSFSVVTNGILYNQPLIDKCHYDKNFTVQLSLDGSCEEINAFNRGRGNFAKAIRTLNALHGAINKPRVKMVVTQQNIDDISNFYKLVVNYGAEPDFGFVNKRGNANDDFDLIGVSPKDRTKAILKIKQLGIQTGVDAFLPRCTIECPFTTENPPLSLLIKTDGSVHPCQMLYDKNHCIGNIYNDSDEQLDKGFDAVTNLAKQRLSIDYGCNKCIVAKLCGKGCPAEALSINGDFMSSDNNCITRRLQFVSMELKEYVNNVSNQKV